VSRDWQDPVGLLRGEPGALIREAWATWPEPGVPSMPAEVERVGWFLPGLVAYVVVRVIGTERFALYVAQRLPSGALHRCLHYTLGWSDAAKTPAILRRCARRFLRDGTRAVTFQAPVVFFNDGQGPNRA
jgi:hypothetical protein